MLYKKTVFWLSVYFLFTCKAYSQEIFPAWDSLPLSKPKILKQTYQFNHPALQEISLVYGPPRATTRLPKKVVSNVSEGILTLFTGIITTSTEESVWVTENELKANDGAYTWRVPVFFPGTFLKTRERLKQADGSSTLVTEEGLYPDWHKGAYGLILEKSDTVGDFTLHTDLSADSIGLQWISRIETESQWVGTILKKYEPNRMNYDLIITGYLRGQRFSIISSGNYFRSLVFIDDEPEAIFQSDPNFVILRKKDRIPPYLLLNPSLDEARSIDFFQLAMLHNLLAGAVRTDFY